MDETERSARNSLEIMGIVYGKLTERANPSGSPKDLERVSWEHFSIA
jgi:hypothetical protein